MKKVLALLVILALLAVSVFAMVGCTDNEEQVRVEKIELEIKSGTVFYVGDAFDATKFVITATLTDKTETPMSSTDGVYYDKSELKLVNNKYSQAGTVKLKVIYLDKYPAEVEITVHETK